MHWFKRSSAFDLQYCYCNGWGDEMTGKHFLSEELFHRDIRRFEHVTLLPEPGSATSAWDSALQWRPQRLSEQGPAQRAEETACISVRKRRQEETCGVTLQNAELEAARGDCCGGNAAQATGWRESIRGSRREETKLCVELKFIALLWQSRQETRSLHGE